MASSAHPVAVVAIIGFPTDIASITPNDHSSGDLNVIEGYTAMSAIIKYAGLALSTTAPMKTRH